MSELIEDSPFPDSPVMPKLMAGDATIQFECHKGISCFNACCKNIDISLTPYDILRLKKRLNMTSGDFLVKYTFPYVMDKDGMAGVKFKPVEGGTACQFMTEEGCGVYEDRPTACRYYPIALLSMRKQNEFTEREAYAMVQEDHCKGHFEPRTITINQYRKEQGVEEYDELSAGWRQLILKKKSAGPTIGAPSKRSLQLFFIACYDLDRFREFVTSPGFNEVYLLDDALKQQIATDDVALMQFAFRLLRQVLFNEASIDTKDDALDIRLARKKEREAKMDEIVAKVGPIDFTRVDPNDKYNIKD
jgi:uncharacterized protein